MRNLATNSKGLPSSLRVIGSAALALALVLATGAADARGRRGGGPGGPGPGGPGPGGPGMEHGMGHGQRILAQLDLTDAQKTGVSALRAEHQTQMKALHEQMRQLHESMRSLVERDDATVEEVEAIEAQMDELHRVIRTERRAFRGQAFDLLTPEQKAQVPNAWRLGVGPGPGMGPGMHRGWGGRGKGFDQDGKGFGKGGPGCRGPRGWGQGDGPGWAPPDAPADDDVDDE